MLLAPVDKVDRAKYYVIDVHNHINDARGIGERLPPQRVIEVMDNTNVKTVVILTGMWGDKLQKVVDEMVKPILGAFLYSLKLIGARLTILTLARKWSPSSMTRCAAAPAG
jgi:hypothetical protein